MTIKTNLRKAFEAWADIHGHFEDEHYYFQGSQTRRNYSQAHWEGWLAHAHYFAALANEPVECEQCDFFKHVEVCPICNGSKQVESSLSHLADTIKRSVEI